MNTVDFGTMTSKALVEWYNSHSSSQITKFRDRATAERRCWELKISMEEVASPEAAPPAEQVAAKRPNMTASLSLDRTIECITTGGVWKNAHRLWVENYTWMTGGQQDRLTKTLYSAAKRGEQVVVEINERQFRLVNVGGVSQDD